MARVWFHIRYRGIAKRRFPRYSLSPRLNASINLFLLGKYFGEISIARIKKSTLTYVVLCYVLSTHIILTGFYYHRSLTHASDWWQSDWAEQVGRPVALPHQWELHWCSPYLPGKWVRLWKHSHGYFLSVLDVPDENPKICFCCKPDLANGKNTSIIKWLCEKWLKNKISQSFQT